jgi:small neutral amino acid transporter SnatA (MarC family)
MFMFLAFAVLFLGGLVMMGISFELPEWNALVFIGGILVVSFAMGMIMHARGNAHIRDRKN